MPLEYFEKPKENQASAPQPEGEWRIVVDAQGDRVRDRAPGPDDFLARQAAKFKFGGTVPKFQPSGKDRKKDIADWVEYQIRADRNKELIEKAVFLVSQEDDGRRLLQMAEREGFTIVFDHERTKGEGAVGICDYQNRQIPLAEGRSAVEVALTLKHELQHFEDIQKGIGYDTSDTLHSATAANRALESNARVAEAKLAATMMQGNPRGPERRFRTNALMQNFQGKNPECGMAAMRNAKKLLSGDWKGFANAVFAAYYDQKRTLEYYDKRTVEAYGKDIPDEKRERELTGTHEYYEPRWIEHRLKQVREKLPGMLQTERWDAEKIAKRVTQGGQEFLDTKKFDPAARKNTSLTGTGMTMLAKLKEKIEAIGIPLTNPNGLDADAKKEKKPGLLDSLSKRFTKAVTQPPPETKPFSPVVMPSRLDGIGGTDGRRAHERTSEYFGKIVKGMNTGGTDLDRLSYSVDEYIHQNRGISNIRGHVGRLLDAGFLAPVAAFPADYLNDLARRCYGGGGSKFAQTAPDLSAEELKLFDHWRTMADKGMDPMWGDEKTKEKSWINGDRDLEFQSRLILDILPEPKKTAQPRAERKATATA